MRAVALCLVLGLVVGGCVAVPRTLVPAPCESAPAVGGT